MEPKYVLILDFFVGCLNIIKLTDEELRESEEYEDFEDFLLTIEEKYGFRLNSRPLKSAHLRNIVRKQYPADFFNKPQKSPHGSFEVVCGGS